MVTQAPRRAAALAAIVFILASIGLTLFVWRSLGGSIPLAPEGYRFHAAFANASQLEPNAVVRVAGVDVGRVISIRQDGLRTDATLQIDPQYAPLHADARAILRQKTLLGETFVEMTTGSRRAPAIKEGGRLANAQIAATQPLDRVLGVLDPKTRRDVAALFTDGATALQHRGADLNAALGNLDPVSSQLATIAGILDHQRGSVRSLVSDGGGVLRTVGAHRAAVQRLVRSGDAVLGATAARNRQVTETVRALPGLLAQLQKTSATLVETGRAAGPTLHAFRPVAPLVAPGLRALNTLAPQIRAALIELDGALPTARRALPATAHLVRSLIPFTGVLYPATREIAPIISYISAYRRELTATVANTAAATQGESPGLDGKPVHYLRALVPVSEETFVTYPHRLASNRHNAYFAPGGLDHLATGLLASSCANTGNAQTVPVLGTGAPACKVQPGWKLPGGKPAYFQRLQRTPPR